FQRQVEVLSQLSPHWGERETHEHERILCAHPFDDLAGIRAVLTRQLREAGHPPETACQMACEQYPPPVIFDPAWRTSNVTALAQSIYDARAFARLALLPDALKEA